MTRIKHIIQPKRSNYKAPLTAGMKCTIALCDITTGDRYNSLMYGLRVTHTISKIIRQVCDATLEKFAEEQILCPGKSDEMKSIAKQSGNNRITHTQFGFIRVIFGPG
ncbi:hypothetical protein DPMN_101378 [Dreissena polymorpha]|uniref:Uncharacterized protein n=1 Tax=Dreissena polymorpha TaxID=45954 RepID=A0A9D4R898_DREPO|nr:hypothetical protein DPMN_101378 [Dreissena polymorpha]